MTGLAAPAAAKRRSMAVLMAKCERFRQAYSDYKASTGGSSEGKANAQQEMRTTLVCTSVDAVKTSPLFSQNTAGGSSLFYPP